MKRRAFFALVLGTLGLGGLAGGTAGCSKPTERFESAVQVVRREVVEVDADGGAPTEIDLEVEWDACSGDQFQVIRGDGAFAACTANYTVGTYAPVIVQHFWDPRGYYRWDIERFGECPRPIEPASYGSYEKSQDCEEVKNHGQTVGFYCNRKAARGLLRRCPWTKRD